MANIHFLLLGRLLNDRSLPEETPVLILQVLQDAGLKEDIILLLHQDREKHHLMSYFYRIESLPEIEQTELTALVSIFYHTYLLIVLLNIRQKPFI